MSSCLVALVEVNKEMVVDVEVVPVVDVRIQFRSDQM